jgi:hypothetical protein
MSEPKRLPEEEFKVVVEEAKQFIMNNLKKDNKFYVGTAVRRLMARFAIDYHDKHSK